MKFAKQFLMITTLVASAVTFASFDVSAAEAEKKPALKLDTNHDNVVDQKEFDASKKAQFEKLDTNKDGKISADEMKAAKAAKAKDKKHKDKKNNKRKDQ